MAAQTQFQNGIEAAFEGLPRRCHLPLHTEDRAAWQDGYDLGTQQLVRLRDSLREVEFGHVAKPKGM